jgi:tetratricopeptide (TPR) repeat protein
VEAAMPGTCELPPELQRELDALAAREGRVSHYELLGIGPDADGTAVRRAFLLKSKQLHPDAWYQRQLGRFGPLLSRAFQRVTLAYQVLSDEEARAAYDEKNEALFGEADKAKIRQRGEATADEERRARERRERLLRTKGFARIGAARQLYERAIEHAAEGNRLAAVAELQAARQLDPARKEIAQKLVELEKEGVRARIANAVASGIDWEEKGEFARALTVYQTALQQDPTNVAAGIGAARCAAEQQDWQRTCSLCAKVLEAAPTDVEAQLLLSRALIKVGSKVRAKAQLQQLLKQKPGHAEAMALLKRL